MLRRARIWIALVLAALLAATTLSWTPAAALRITDESGMPAADAYARYYYRGTLLNPVHPVTFVAGGSAIVRADPGGRIVVPARWHVRRPFPLSTPPRLFVAAVYVPRLHNAFGPVAAATTSSPGAFTIAERMEHVVVFDLGGDPNRWEISLRNLYDVIRDTLASDGSMAPADAADATTRAHARELIGHLRQEYAAFVERFGETMRARPPASPYLSEEERGVWEQQVDTQLAREPRWGPFVQRIWRNNLASLEAMEASPAPSGGRAP